MSNPKHPRVNIPLAGRTFERTQGCWNCKHFASPEESLKFWQANGRPEAERRISAGKLKLLTFTPNPQAIARLANTNPDSPCPCGRGRTYKACHRPQDQEVDASMRIVEGIEVATAHMERFENSITKGDEMLGFQGLCRNRLAPQGGGFKSDKFLCDQWSGAQGASVARGGQKADALPEEIKDKIGDGN
jgi:hypothetical protein